MGFLFYSLSATRQRLTDVSINLTSVFHLYFESLTFLCSKDQPSYALVCQIECFLNLI